MGVVAAPAQQAAARLLAERLGAPLLTDMPAADGGVCVRVTQAGYELLAAGPSGSGAVTFSFDDPALRHRRRAGHNELLGRAVGWRSARAPCVLDATAGFGRDAFTLADLGCEVLLCERNALMAALLQLAIDEALAADPWLREVVSRFQLVAGDARGLAPARLERVETIYLDPMFSSGRRALPGKDMQVLARLLEEDSPGSDDEDLLAWALEQDVRRVVVKRPRRAPSLAGLTPGHQLSGRAIRFDVYPVNPRKAPAGDGAQP